MKSKIIKAMGILIVVSMVLMSVTVNADDPEPIPMLAQQGGQSDSSSSGSVLNGNGLIEVATLTPRPLQQYQPDGKFQSEASINNVGGWIWDGNTDSWTTMGEGDEPSDGSASALICVGGLWDPGLSEGVLRLRGIAGMFIKVHDDDDHICRFDGTLTFIYTDGTSDVRDTNDNIFYDAWSDYIPTKIDFGREMCPQLGKTIQRAEIQGHFQVDGDTKRYVHRVWPGMIGRGWNIPGISLLGESAEIFQMI